MKRFAALALVAGLAGSTALASDLNLTVREAGSGSSDVFAAPGSTVNYEIVGVLSDTANEGLALFGLTLSFDGGDLSAANAPGSLPMTAFDRPDGITNPGAPDVACPPQCGFGGTIIAGDLVQVGGGQNTILNTIDNAPFPIGAVITNVGHTEVVLATGSLVMPGAGVYHLTIPADSVFANVIRQGETGVPFWATDAAGVGAITNLTLNGDVPSCLALVSSSPDCGVSLWRSQKNFIELTFDGPAVAPDAGEIEIRELLAGGAFGGDISGSFTFTPNGNVLRIDEVGAALTHRKWYAVTSSGTGANYCGFERDYPVQVGDANADGRVVSFDVSVINGGNPCFSCPDDRRDINGDNRITSFDVSVTNGSIISFPVTKPDLHDCNP